MPSGNVPTTTPTSPGAMDTICKNESDCCSSGSDTNVSTSLTKQMSYDPTEYVQRARVTKAAPPKPAANPLQFVQIKPCNLYQSAQEQLKRAEQVKKVKEVVKEEPEDWQSNLDNWKTGRRKLVAPIIERVIETKKYESEDLVKNRKKSKTFSEMMEERGSKGRKCSLRVYNDDEVDDDLNGFGFSTNDTISGKSSVSEDYENQSVNVIDALDIALNAIDIEKPNELIDIATSFDEIYEEINDFTPLKVSQSASVEKANGQDLEEMESVDEPYYQVPKRQSESYYEVPTSRPIPVYENVDMYYDLTASQNKFTVDGGASKLNTVPIEIGSKCVMQPPKEKPPPPPIEPNELNGIEEADEEPLPQDAMKRINSTKRIKKEIRNKRSSFLGIEGTNDDENYLEFSVARPPNRAEFIKEERRIEKQIYIKTGLYDSSDTAESRDSGVSENHSRQSSEPVTSSSSDEPERETNKFLDATRPEIISALEKDKQLLEAGKNALALECRVLGTQQWVFNDGFSTSSQTDEIDPILQTLDNKERQRCIDEQIREEEEVLRVERELLQLEQEELKRQRENMINRKMYEQRIQQQQQLSTPPKQQQQPTDHRRSLQNITAVNGGGNLYANVYTNDINTSNGSHHVSTDHRKSMPNLQEMTLHEIPLDKCQMPVPPAKPLRVQEYLKYNKQIYSNGTVIDPRTNQSMPMHLNTIHSNSNDEFQTYSGNTGSSNGSLNSATQQQYGNMTRHTLHALSAAPKPKFQDAWVQQRTNNKNNNNNNNNNYENTNDWNRDYVAPAVEQNIRPRLKDPIGDSWLSLQQKRRSDPNFNYNKHWLIQEAEQRRLDQARSNRTNGNSLIPRKGSADNKPLPDAVIQTLTQRVQNKLNDKKRLENQQNHYHYHHHPHQSIIGSSTEQLVLPQHQHNGNVSYHQTPLQLGSPKSEAPREILSVSGKKKCSYCCEELGRGAAMIIESLRLFYHLDCFKCCVCRVQLGDGISGADVRVRNQKLHCNNCFSSDDGIKFSCV